MDDRGIDKMAKYLLKEQRSVMNESPIRKIRRFIRTPLKTIAKFDTEKAAVAMMKKTKKKSNSCLCHYGVWYKGECVAWGDSIK